MKSSLAISPDGALIGALVDDQLTVTAVSGTQTVIDTGDAPTAVAAADGEIWVVVAGDEPRLHRCDGGGAAIGEPVELAATVGPEAAFSERSVGPAGTVLLGAEPLSLALDCGEIQQAPFRPVPTFATAIDNGSTLFVRDRSVCVAGPDGTGPLEAAPLLPEDGRLAAAVALSDAKVFALFVAGEQPAIWLLDARRGEVRRRIPCPQADRVAFAAERGHVIVLSADGEWLTVLDLRFGKPLAEWRNEPRLLDIVLAPQSDRVAALRANDDGAEVVWADYRDLLRTRRKLAWNRHGQKAPERARRAAPAADATATDDDATEAVSSDVAMPLAAGGGSADGHAYTRSPIADAADSEDAPAEDSGGSFDREPPPLPPPTPLPSLLTALAPVSLPPVETGELALRSLERSLALVAAWTQRAIAEGWDSGRLAFAASDELPFEHEVSALLGGRGGRASEKLAAARAEATGLEVEHDRVHQRDVAACSGEATHAITPLATLAHELGLSQTATDILLIVAAPAVWGEMARLYGICANDEDRPLCDEWLVTQILGAARGGRRAIAAELDPGAPLITSGLIRVGSGRRPFASLFPHPLLVRRLYGDTFESDAGDEWISGEGPRTDYDDLILHGEHDRAISALTRASQGALRLVVSGKRGSGRRSVIAALAARANRRVGWIDLRQHASRGATLPAAVKEALRRAELRGWLPAVTGGEALDGVEPTLVREVTHALAAFRGPLAYRCEVNTKPHLEPGYLQIELDALPEGARHVAWHRMLEAAALPTEPAARFAALYRFGPGTISRVIDRACAARESGSELDVVETTRLLEDGIRQVRAGSAGNLATRVERVATWSQICLPSEVLDSVREFIGRVRHRRLVFDRWGFDRVMTSSRGLTALFEGRPGTGKTMVAGVIARELGCDLYRVDLSRVLSKWVGETERHLAEVFDAAEGGQMILLFDEADSLFSKRTEVRSSNDRFANIEVNYLLQRLDSFDGIAILTTNFGKSIDPAFKRRLSLRLTFPFPDEELREKLWKAHLPAELPTAGELDVEALARKYPLSGGYIRNIILRAAFLAAHEGQSLTQEHLERAISLEYRAMGKLSESGVLE